MQNEMVFAGNSHPQESVRAEIPAHIQAYKSRGYPDARFQEELPLTSVSFFLEGEYLSDGIRSLVTRAPMGSEESE